MSEKEPLFKFSSNIEYTAKNFIDNCNFDEYSLVYKNGEAKVVGYKGSQTVTIKIFKTENCRSIEATTSYSPGLKSDLTSDIIALRQQGKTQSEVAAILNMSQSYVSKIERNCNTNKNN